MPIDIAENAIHGELSQSGSVRPVEDTRDAILENFGKVPLHGFTPALQSIGYVGYGVATLVNRPPLGRHVLIRRKLVVDARRHEIQANVQAAAGIHHACRSRACSERTVIDCASLVEIVQPEARYFVSFDPPVNARLIHGQAAVRNPAPPVRVGRARASTAVCPPVNRLNCVTNLPVLWSPVANWGLRGVEDPA